MLTDLARKYFGPEGLGSNYEASDLWPADLSDSSAFDVAASSGSYDPARLASWSDFHQKAAQLPPDDREVFDLIYYQGLSQLEVAEILGISDRTVQRRWQAVRSALRDDLDDQMPN